VIGFPPDASVDSFDEIGAIVAEFRKGQRDANVKPDDNDVLVALHAHVAVDDGEAKVQAAAPFDLYVATRLYAKQQTYEDVLRSGLSLIGGVQTVARKLKRLEEMGVHHVLAIHNFGMIPQYQVMASMDRFAAIVQDMNGSSAATHEKKSMVA
jgi:alkanesulfonate monooxygenase SsuD/methylene tetrahydromethanopterin reductase-like flavin-dependent oxidoreductase (luciferase family)